MPLRSETGLIESRSAFKKSFDKQFVMESVHAGSILSQPECCATSTLQPSRSRAREFEWGEWPKAHAQCARACPIASRGRCHGKIIVSVVRTAAMLLDTLKGCAELYRICRSVTGCHCPQLFDDSLFSYAQ